MPTSDLTAIVEKSIDGDLRAFEKLVERFQDMAVGYAYSILGDFQMAEDAAQEAFVDAHRNIGQLREPQAFSSWFRRIVFKHCDRVSRAMKGALVPLDAVPEQLARTPDPFEVTAMGETRDVVHRALAELPERNREVVTLHYISQYTQTEIASYLGVSVAAIKRRLREGRALLKDRFRATFEDEMRQNRPSRDERLKEKVMEIVAGNKEQHAEEIYEISERRTAGSIQHEWRAGRIAHSHTDWNVSRIGTIDGKVVGAYGIFDISMRVGSARLRVGGHNWGTMHEDYEDQEDEINQRLAMEAFQAMREEGYDMAATFESGLPKGYGYTFGWREYDWSIPIDQFPADEPDFDLIECPSDYRKDLGDLYNRYAEGLTGTALRPTFLRNKHPDNFTTWYWTDASGRPLGYVSGNNGGWFTLDLALADHLNQPVLSPPLKQAIEKNRFGPLNDSSTKSMTGHLLGAIEKNRFGPLNDETLCIRAEENRWWIIDYATRDDWSWGDRVRLIAWKSDRGIHVSPGLQTWFWVDEAAGDSGQLLSAIGHLARQSGHDAVRFDRLHYRSPIAKWLRKLEIAGLTIRAPNYYLRILNLKSVFEKLAPELSLRLQDSPLADWQGDLAISNGDEKIVLAVNRTDVKVVPAVQTEHSIKGGREILQLIVGTEVPDEVVEMNDIELTGDARHLIQVLFPIQYPQMENQAM